MAGTLDRLDPNGPGTIPASTALGAAMAKSLGTAPAKTMIPENADFREQEPLLPPKLNEQAEPPPATEEKKQVEPPKADAPVEKLPDPYEPLKQRLGERPLDEWLSEVDNIHLEKETLNSRVVELEEIAKERYERLVEYDFKNSEDYVTNVTEPIRKSAEQLVFLMGNDNESAKLAIGIWEETKDNLKERRERLKNLAAEQDISLGDLNRAVTDYMDRHSQAEKFTKNWETTRTEKLKAQVLRQEEEARVFQESQRRSRQAALFHAQAKISELGIPHLDGFDDAKRSWESVISGIENGKAADLNQEVTYAVLGRLVMQNMKQFKTAFKELADLQEASRSNPNASLPKQDNKPVVNNPLLGR